MDKKTWQRENADRHREHQKTYLAKNRSAILERKRQYRESRSPEEKERDAQRVKDWKNRNRKPLKNGTGKRKRNYFLPEEKQIKKDARNKVRLAVRKGDIIKLPCVECGLDKSEAHHYAGYEEENILKIEWLCRSHHLRKHPKAQ